MARLDLADRLRRVWDILAPEADIPTVATARALIVEVERELRHGKPTTPADHPSLSPLAPRPPVPDQPATSTGTITVPTTNTPQPPPPSPGPKPIPGGTGPTPIFPTPGPVNPK